MIKKLCCFSLLFALLLTSVSWSFGDSEDTQTRIIKVSNALFDRSTSMETIVNSLIGLLDEVSSLTSSSKYKEEIKYHIDVAKDLLKNTSLFNDKARQYMSFAYRMITNGQKYQRPKELDEFVTPSEAQEKGMKYSKELIEKALDELKACHKEDEARLLLELVLMVVTPISG